MAAGPVSPFARSALALDAVVWRVVDAVLLACVAVLALTVGAQVVSRLAGASVPWTEELSRFLFLWTAFLGMACGFRRLEHPRIALLLPLLRRLGPAFAVHVYVAASLAFFSVTGWHAAGFVVQQLRFGERSAVLGVGMYVASLPMLIACVLAVFATLVTAYVDRSTRVALEREGLAPCSGPEDART